MTILFAGGEMGAFIPSDSTVTEATTQPYDSAFARGVIRMLRSSEYAESFTFATTDDVWIHFDLAMSSTTSTGGVLTAYDGSGVARVRLNSSSGASSIWKLQTSADGSAWTDQGSSITIDSTARQTVDVHIVSNTASGSAKLYVAGTERLDSGTVDLSGFTGIAKVRFTGRSSASEVGVSQCIIADESTIGWRLTTVPPTGAGASTAWTGGYTEVDEFAYSDADFINSATADQVELFSHSTTVPAGYTVRGVAVTARAKCGSGGPQNIEMALRSGGTTYFGSSQALDAGYGAFVEIWETDPATSADFTGSAITALQFGVKSIT